MTLKYRSAAVLIPYWRRALKVESFSYSDSTRTAHAAIHPGQIRLSWGQDDPEGRKASNTPALRETLEERLASALTCFDLLGWAGLSIAPTPVRLLHQKPIVVKWREKVN